MLSGRLPTSTTSSTRSRVSVGVTAYNEGEQIVPCLDRILEAVTLPCEVLVVYDTPDDTTIPVPSEVVMPPEHDPQIFTSGLPVTSRMTSTAWSIAVTYASRPK